MIASTDGEIWMLNRHSRGKRRRVAESRRVEKQRENDGRRDWWYEKGEVCRVCTLCGKKAHTEIFIPHRKWQ